MSPVVMGDICFNFIGKATLTIEKILLLIALAITFIGAILLTIYAIKRASQNSPVK